MCICNSKREGGKAPASLIELPKVRRKLELSAPISRYVDRKIGFCPFLVFGRFLADSCRHWQKLTKKCRFSTKKTKKKSDEIRRNNWFSDVFFGFPTKSDGFRRSVLRCFFQKCLIKAYEVQNTSTCISLTLGNGFNGSENK